MSQHHAQFQIRPFQPESDFAPLIELLSAVEAVDQSGEVTTEAQQREQMTWPGHDLSKDRWVLISTDNPTTFLGYGDSWHMPGNTYADIALAIHPDYRRRGFGEQLLQHVLDRARQQGAATVNVYADGTHTPAQSFLEKHHFHMQGAFVELFFETKNTIQVSKAHLSGYHVLPVTQEIDAQLLTKLLNEGYEGLFGHKVLTEDVVQTKLIPRPHQHYLLLQSPTQTIVGLCRMRIPPSDDAMPTIGYLDAPGILAEHRQPARYQLLAQAGLQFLQQKQISEVVMESWGDEPEVVAQYRDIGFMIRRRFLAYEYML